MNPYHSSQPDVEREQEQEAGITDAATSALRDAFRIYEGNLQTALQRLETNYAQLERTQSQMRAMVDASPDAILFLTPDGRPISVNTRFTDFFGLDDATVLSQLPDQLKALLKTLFEDPSLLEQSFILSTSDPEQIYREHMVQVEALREFEFSSLPVKNVDQTYIGQLYVWHDVTQERAVERLQSEFVAMVSHELRTPLTSIKGYINLMLGDDEVGELNSLQREFLQVSLNNAHRLENLVNDLLDISRLESGKLEVHPEPFDINHLITELTPSFQPGWDAKRQTFTLCLPDEALLVCGDPGRVAQILNNLLSNAHKYTPEGGYITLSVEVQGTVVRLAVTDNGIGLSTEEQAHLFTRFYRALNPKTETINGTGLGLTISRSLVELQGGEMQVESEPGQGSTFRFTLPLAQS